MRVGHAALSIGSAAEQVSGYNGSALAGVIAAL